jgi:putative hydrolase of the HAD superfamily
MYRQKDEKVTGANDRSLPRVLLFDMDDTILTDTVNGDRCWQAAFAELAQQAAHLHAEAAVAAIKQQARWYWSDHERHRLGRLELNAARRAIVVEALRRVGTDDRALAHLLADTCSRLRDEAIGFCDGAHATLCQIRERGVRLALLTNGGAAPQRRKIERFGLAPFFDCILVEGEFGHGKPDQRVYQHALAQLGARPAETWMVGDNLEWDVQAPQQLGILGIWVDVAGAGVPTGSPVQPDRIIRTLRELLENGGSVEYH